MKNLILLFALLGMMACRHDYNTYRSEGIITEADTRYCGCCGGWFIEIEGVMYLAYIAPMDVDRLDLDAADFPIPVRLDWEKQPTNCLENYIVVSQIERR